MNGTNELLRAILKIDEEERARTQATEEYRQKAQADKAAKAKQMEEQAMEDMRHDVDEFAQAEKARAEGELAAQAKRKQQILDQLDQQLQKNKDAWVDTILTRVLGGGAVTWATPRRPTPFWQRRGRCMAAGSRRGTIRSF